MWSCLGSEPAISINIGAIGLDEARARAKALCERAYQLSQPSLGLLILSMFPLKSQFVLLLLELWVDAFLKFAEDLARKTSQYNCPTLSKGIKGHIVSLTSSPGSSGSAIEAQWIEGRAPYNLLNMAAACQEISASINADISLVSWFSVSSLFKSTCT